MRGPMGAPRRAGFKPRNPSEAVARTYSHPAPYGGWNARGNLANMAYTDAILMDNVFPGVQDVSLRAGCSDWVTGFAADVKSLLAYNGKSSTKLFASTDTDIYDVTLSGTVGASVTTCTNGQWVYVNFTNAGNSYLVAVNGVDGGKTFDGTTWAALSVTGVTASSLKYVTMHQKRLWFVEKNSMNLWYLAVEAVSGAATQFPVGSLFKRGGSITAIGTWTVDSGSGMDDLLAIATSAGEIAIYQGTDPASSTTWALQGVYELAPPVGSKPFANLGGDLLYLSRNGLVPLSKLTQSVVIDRSQQVSYKIDGAMLTAAEAYGTVAGWDILPAKLTNMLIINVPISANSLSYQFVMNTITGAWCRFTGWNASCWAVSGNSVFWAGGRKVAQALVGHTDGGEPIVGQIIQAYSHLGMRGQKEITLTRPNFAFSNSLSLQMSWEADFKSFPAQTSLIYGSTAGAGIWDSSLWDSAIWDGGEQVLDPKWTTIPGEPGYMHALKLQVTSSLSSFSWTSTDIAYKPAGIL